MCERERENESSCMCPYVRVNIRLCSLLSMCLFIEQETKSARRHTSARELRLLTKKAQLGQKPSTDRSGSVAAKRSRYHSKRTLRVWVLISRHTYSALYAEAAHPQD